MQKKKNYQGGFIKIALKWNLRSGDNLGKKKIN